MFHIVLSYKCVTEHYTQDSREGSQGYTFPGAQVTYVKGGIGYRDGLGQRSRAHQKGFSLVHPIYHEFVRNSRSGTR